MKLLNVGFNNMVSSERIIAVISPDSAPAKRMVQEAKDRARAIDCTSGRRTRSVIITDNDLVILSAIQPETISGRLEGAEDDAEKAEVL